MCNDSVLDDIMCICKVCTCLINASKSCSKDLGSDVLKYIFYVLNTTIFLVGAATLGVCIWVALDSSSLLSFPIKDAPEELAQLANVVILLLSVGLILLVICFQGCYGAVMESRCMLLIFITFILIILIAELAGAIVLLVFQPLVGEILAQVGDKVVQSIEKDYGNSSGITTLWNTTMEELKCCGYYNYTDFENSPFVTEKSQYPIECCKDDVGCTAAAAATAGIDGCFPKLVGLNEDMVAIMGAVALGGCAVKVVAITFTMALYKDIED